MTRVKICGFTREDDVVEAVRLGVDFLGLNLISSSPRRITAIEAINLCHIVEKSSTTSIPRPNLVALVSESEQEAVNFLLEKGRDFFHYVQFYGSDSSFLVRAGLRTIYPIRGRANESLMREEDGRHWALLMDAYGANHLGGTGQVCDWSAAAVLAQRNRLFLAGGLKPSNVGEAIATVKPYAVDVASGVETAPGVKDYYKMREFMKEVKRADGC